MLKNVIEVFFEYLNECFFILQTFFVSDLFLRICDHSEHQKTNAKVGWSLLLVVFI